MVNIWSNGVDRDQTSFVTQLKYDLKTSCGKTINEWFQFKCQECKIFDKHLNIFKHQSLQNRFPFQTNHRGSNLGITFAMTEQPVGGLKGRLYFRPEICRGV